MTNFYASQSQQNIQTFTEQNQSNLNSFLGSTAVPTAATANFSTLNSYLSSSSALNASAAPSWTAYVDKVDAQASSGDALVTASAAAWAQQVATQSPLTEPAAPAILKASTNPADLLFGNFFDQSVANLVKSAPNVFASSNATTIGSPAFAAAWAKATATAAGQSASSFASYFPDPCGSTLLLTMASGHAPTGSPSSCSSCVTSGLFLHNQMPFLINPSGVLNTKVPTKSQAIIPPGSFNALPAWQQKLLIQSSSALKKQVSQSIQGPIKPSFSCASSSPAVSSTLSAAVPNILAGLG